MRIGIGQVRPARSAIFLIAVAILIAFATILLLVAVGFAFTAGEIMVNPNARAEEKVKLEHAANFAFSLFAAVQVVVAFLILKSGVLKTRWHMALRAVGTSLASILVSFFLVFLTVRAGVLPSPFMGVYRTLSDWIRRVI